MYSCFVKWIWF